MFYCPNDYSSNNAKKRESKKTGHENWLKLKISFCNFVSIALFLNNNIGRANYLTYLGIMQPLYA